MNTASRQLTPTEENLLRAYRGGATEKEAIGKTKENPKQRQHRTLRKRLENEKLLIKMKGKTKRDKCRWYPADEVYSSIPKKEIKRAKKLKRYVNPAELKLELITNLDSISTMGVNILQEIEQEGELCTKRRRIYEICARINFLLPFIQNLKNYLEITFASDYFREENPPLIFNRFNRQIDIRGPIGFLKPGIKSVTEESQLIRPSLREWKAYLILLMGGIEKLNGELESGAMDNRIDRIAALPEIVLPGKFMFTESHRESSLAYLKRKKQIKEIAESMGYTVN
jgi:hypothetical protein